MLDSSQISLYYGVSDPSKYKDIGIQEIVEGTAYYDNAGWELQPDDRYRGIPDLQAQLDKVNEQLDEANETIERQRNLMTAAAERIVKTIKEAKGDEPEE